MEWSLAARATNDVDDNTHWMPIACIVEAASSVDAGDRDVVVITVRPWHSSQRECWFLDAASMNASACVSWQRHFSQRESWCLSGTAVLVRCRRGGMRARLVVLGWWSANHVLLFLDGGNYRMLSRTVPGRHIWSGSLATSSSWSAQEE